MADYPTLYAAGVIFWAVPWYDYANWSQPGVYMLCRREWDGARTILYIGEAACMATRMGPDHEHWHEALGLGMDEVHVHLIPKTTDERRRVETHLRQCYQTPLNRQSPASQRLGVLAELARANRPAPRMGGLLAAAARSAPRAAPGRGNGLLPSQYPAGLGALDALARTRPPSPEAVPDKFWPLFGLPQTAPETGPGILSRPPVWPARGLLARPTEAERRDALVNALLGYDPPR